MNPRKKNEAVNPQPQSTAFLDVLRKHLAIFTEHYRQPISELSVVAYAEDLARLTPQQLDAACTEARRTSEFMPVSATILAAHDSLRSREHQFSGPQLDWDPELEKQRIERQSAWKRMLANGEVKTEPDPEPTKRRVAHVTKPLDEQKEELRKRGWLQ